jgi:hypothetical protein
MGQPKEAVGHPPGAHFPGLKQSLRDTALGNVPDAACEEANTEDGDVGASNRNLPEGRREPSSNVIRTYRWECLEGHGSGLDGWRG